MAVSTLIASYDSNEAKSCENSIARLFRLRSITTKILSTYKHSTLLLIDYICMYVIVHRELVLNNENKVELSFLTAAF